MPAKEDTSAIPDKTISHFEGEVLNLQPSLPWKDQLWLDLRVVPSLGMLYLIIFLDRSNIANARIEGLEKSLHMPLNGFNTAIWIFYLPFVLIMIPSNILLTLPKIRPSYYLGTAVFFLGIVAMCQGLTRSYGGLLVCRFLMGCLEGVLPAGEFPQSPSFSFPPSLATSTVLTLSRCITVTCNLLHAERTQRPFRVVLRLL